MSTMTFATLSAQIQDILESDGKNNRLLTKLRFKLLENYPPRPN